MADKNVRIEYDKKKFGQATLHSKAVTGVAKRLAEQMINDVVGKYGWKAKTFSEVRHNASRGRAVGGAWGEEKDGEAVTNSGLTPGFVMRRDAGAEKENQGELYKAISKKRGDL